MARKTRGVFSSYPAVKASQHYSRKYIFLAIGLAVVACIIVLWPSRVNSPVKKNNGGETRDLAKTSNRIRFIATGDTIAHDALNAQAKKSDGSYDYYQFMKPLQKYFDAADVRFCNQAVPGGGPAFGISGYPVFNSPLEVAHDLNKLGCNVVNTGTNHTFDKGQKVIDAELEDWDKQPNMLAVAGANRNADEQAKIRYFTVKGVRFAFLSYSTYSNSVPANSYGLNMYNSDTAQQQVTTARANADIVLVSMRWGTEYSPAINANQTEISQKLADWGADVVLGHGPHVLEPVKQLTGKDGRKTLVWYSLGNFLNAQIETEALVSGIAIMDIDTKTKTIEAPKYLPIYMHYDWTAQQKANEDLLKRRAFTMIPLDAAAPLLARSQNNTTVDAQTKRVSDLLNSYTKVELVTSKNY